MIHLCVVLLLSASAFSESQVRETETWMPMKSSLGVARMSYLEDDVESSGDFAIDQDDDDYYPNYDDEDEDEDDFSGSGDIEPSTTPGQRPLPSSTPNVNDNRIPEVQRPVRPTVNEIDLVRNSNEISIDKSEPNDELMSNVLMAHTAEESILNKTEVLAALVVGGALCLLLAVLLVLLLVHRMKKKDEGSYDLVRKPIYTKAATAEIYA
ncbi:syndecan-4 isoform X1 [Synchiropus splendidus]|uniref:syndecan-4 isoform X1 n=1 Tax=Synchiropus splendidus TaxID=270530 RepID=UPI00237EE7EF|nr:syndecan-4 isoform X1 [Synchiropus splendidus]